MRTLTVRQAVALGTVCEAAIHTWRVARLIDNNVVTGTARAIVKPTPEGWPGGMGGPEDDVRDMSLWVTTSRGFETCWPVSELMQEVGNYFIAPYQD